MGNAVHTVDVLDGSTKGMSDRLQVGVLTAVANVIGGSAGAAVVTAVAFVKPVALPYSVQVTTGQDAVAFVSGKTEAGFNVTLRPRLAADTLAVGTMDILVIK